MTDFTHTSEGDNNMSKYTRADFQTARFAKHHNGSVASRRSGLLWPSPWLTAASESYSDSNMADNGWVPVPDQAPGRTITRTEYRDTLDHAVKISGHGDDWERGFYTGLTVGGARVVPDPEPANAEKLAQLHDQYTRLPVQHLPGNGSFADYLDHKGVRAPDHD